MGASVIACRDAAPILELAKHSLDQVSLAVSPMVICDMRISRAATRDSWLDIAALQRRAEPIGIIAAIRNQDVCVRKRRQHGRCPLVVAHLAFCEQQYQRLAVTITDRVKFGVQAAPGAPDTPGKAPFLRRLAAVRCAFRWVASTITVSVAVLAAANSANIRSNTPASLHRMNRL